MFENKIRTGQYAPDFCLHNQNDEKICLNDFKGKWIILYFYPRDNTPGCSIEAIEFTNLNEYFKKENAIVIGISKDTIESHLKFTEKKGLKIILLADTELAVHKLYGVWQLKKFMGKESMGTIRTTFLIDSDRKIAYVWNKVKVKNHAQIVLDKFIDIKNKS